MKRKVAFDTNILIALSKDEIDKAAFALRFRDCRWIISEITEIELLSFSGLTAEKEAEIRVFLRRFRIVRLSRAIKAETMRLRKTLRRKLPDSGQSGKAGLPRSFAFGKTPLSHGVSA